MKRLSVLAAGLLASGLFGSCGDPGPARPRLVVLYATCTFSKEHAGPYADVPYTPNLDAFAAESVVFRRHQSESGQSGISFASIFSGTQAWRHGIYDHPNQLSEDLYLITEAFRDAGYDPWYFTGHQMASYDLGYGQGVEPEQVFDGTRKGPDKRQRLWSFLQPENELTQRLLERLESDPDYRAFVLCNFTVTHGRYHRQIPDREFDRFLADFPELARGTTKADLRAAWEFYDEHRFDLQWGFEELVERLGLGAEEVERFAHAIELTYRADVRYLDGMFGRTLGLLEERGLLDQSVVAFTADHGETLLRDGTLFKWTHGLQLAPEVLGVPWIVRAPSLGVAPGTVDAVTRSMDVYPTLAGLCGIDVSDRVDGEDLSGVLLGREPAPHLEAPSHTTKIGAHMVRDFSTWATTRRYFATDDVDLIWVGVREGDRMTKWVNRGDGEWGAQVFDLAADPHELTDLFDPQDQEQAAAVRGLQEYKALLVERFGAASTDAPEDAYDRLQGLGYIGGGEEE